MEPYPHRIETPSGTRYGIPVAVDGDHITFRMLPPTGDRDAVAGAAAVGTGNAGTSSREVVEDAGSADGASRLPAAGHADGLPVVPYPRSIVITERGGLRAIDRQRRQGVDDRI